MIVAKAGSFAEWNATLLTIKSSILTNTIFSAQPTLSLWILLSICCWKRIYVVGFESTKKLTWWVISRCFEWWRFIIRGV